MSGRDSSDFLRQIESQTQFNYTLAQLTATQKGANISTLQSDGLVKINYTSFAQRQSLALGKFYAEGGSTIGFGFIPNVGVTKLRLIEPTTFVQRFTYTGSLITFNLPATLRPPISSVTVYAWGAGGNGYAGTNNGGGGAFISGNLDISGLSTLYVVVGGIGTNNAVTGGGGSASGGGGGFSGVFKGTTINTSNLLCCAGGGGGGGIYGGGGGGGLTNGSGATTGEGGGTQSAGGSGWNSGGLFSGGGPQNGDGGAGAGGYYGGGGALGSQSGGGGSSYTSLLTNFSGQAGTTGGASGPYNPGGITNQYYVSPYGRSRQNGYVVITTTIYTESFQ